MTPFRVLILALVVVTFAGLFVFLGTAGAATVNGRLGIDAGHVDHAVGLADETSTPYLDTGLTVEAVEVFEANALELGVSTRDVRFDPERGLDFRWHALGLEWKQRKPRRDLAFSAGAQFGLRRQDDLYAHYDYDAWTGYLAFRGYVGARQLVRGSIGLRTRSYDALPEESNVESYAFVETKHFFDAGTMLGASVRLGSKFFTDPAASGVWGVEGTPSTTQLTVAVQASRALGERVGLRANAQMRHALADFPYWSDADVYDSPLLDRYARNGPSAEAAVKVLGPSQLWFEVGGAVTRDDFGAILFADGTADGATRRDDVTSVFTSVSRAIVAPGGRANLRLSLAWRDQASTIDAYDWDGWSVASGLTWSW